MQIQIANCCSEPKTYKSRKALYKHERKYNPDYVDPADRERLAYEDAPKLCEHCQTAIQFEKRLESKYCSRSCAGSVNNTKFPKRVRMSADKCKHCKTHLTRYGAKYCSHKCWKDADIAEILAGLETGAHKVSDRTAKRYLIQSQGYRCEKCCNTEWMDKPIPIQLDHIDGNPDRTTLDNIRLLCCNCHALTPTFGAKNIGSGRAYRRKRYAEGKSW